MGGEDWYLWIKFLDDKKLLNNNFKTVAFSYIGPVFTYPIYRNGTLGEAKKDLEKTAKSLKSMLKKYKGDALISINKALITKASVVIPSMSLYVSTLYTIMKRKGIHEECIHQVYRLFKDNIYAKNFKNMDEEGRIRLDDLELKDDVQKEVTDIIYKVDSDNITKYIDLDGFINDFLKFYGFNQDNVDYNKEINLIDWK